MNQIQKLAERTVFPCGAEIRHHAGRFDIQLPGRFMGPADPRCTSRFQKFNDERIIFRGVTKINIG